MKFPLRQKTFPPGRATNYVVGQGGGQFFGVFRTGDNFLRKKNGVKLDGRLIFARKTGRAGMGVYMKKVKPCMKICSPKKRRQMVKVGNHLKIEILFRILKN